MAKKSNFSSDNGGIMNSGVYGHFGSTVHCKDSDNSFYCNMTKFLNMLVMFIIILLICYVIYMGFKYFFFKKK
jgi:hypothetical protein